MIYLLNPICSLFVPTGMQGSTPLDVAAASVIDNNELALALQEQDLEKVLSLITRFRLTLDIPVQRELTWKEPPAAAD